MGIKDDWRKVMTAGLISIISIMSNVTIVGINEYSKYETALKAKELEYQLTVEHSKQQRTVEDSQNFLQATSKVTAIIEKKIETDISEIFDFDSATFAVLVHLKKHGRATLLDFRNSPRIDLSYPDANDTYLDDLIDDINEQSSELDKKLESHRDHYCSLLSDYVEIAYDYINV